MAKRHGRSTVVYLDGWDITADSNNLEPSVDESPTPTPVFQDISTSYLLGQESVGLVTNHWFNDAADRAHDLMRQRHGSDVVLGAAHGTHQGAYGYAGTARLSVNQPQSPIGAAVGVTANWQGDGDIDIVRVLQGKATITAESGELEDAAETTQGLHAYLQVFEVLGGTPTFHVLHGTASGGSFGTLLSFTGATARTTERVDASGTVRQYLKLGISNGSAIAWVAYRRG